MKILSNYNYGSTYKNSCKPKRVPAFMGFRIPGKDGELPAKIFGSRQMADLFERVTDEKGIDVWLFENTKAAGHPGEQQSVGYEAIIIDSKPDSEQSSNKAIGTRDAKTMDKNIEKSEAARIMEENPNLSKEELKKAIEEGIIKKRKERFAARLKKSIILCHATGDNIAIAAKLQADGIKKQYGEENVEKIMSELYDTALGHQSKSAVAAYNNQ